MKARLALAALCLVAAALAAILARDVWHWKKALRDADARAHVVDVGGDAWKADTVLPGDPARALLGIDDDIVFRKLYVRAAALARRPPAGERDPRRSRTKTALSQVIRSDSDPRQASQAAGVLAILLFTDPPDPDVSPAQRALGPLQDAVLLDPGNVGAKANLELILRQLTSNSPRGRSSPGGGDKGGQGAAGLAPGGRGY
jgi:hypothetical protein